MTWDEVCCFALTFPLVDMGSYHGYPALRVNGKFLTRLGDDRQSLEFKAIDHGEREMLLQAEPSVYFLPEGFRGAGLFVRLSKLNKPTLQGLLERRWRLIAPKALVRAREMGRTTSN